VNWIAAGETANLNRPNQWNLSRAKQQSCSRPRSSFIYNPVDKPFPFLFNEDDVLDTQAKAKLQPTLLLLFNVLLLSMSADNLWAQGGTSNPNAEPDPNLAQPFAHVLDSNAPDNYDFLPIFSDGKFHPSIQGTWTARGYGIVPEITETEFRWFSKTANFFWEHTPDDPPEMIFAIQDFSGRCYLKPFLTESSYILERINKLPKLSRERRSDDPVATLEQVDEIMSAHFPFFEVRNHNWRERVDSARKSVTPETTRTELFSWMESLFAGLNDGHTSLSAEINGERVATKGGMSSIRKALETAFLKTDVDRREFFGGWRDKLFSGIHDQLLQGKSKNAFNENLIWGRITPKVGYLFVGDMASFTEDENQALSSGLANLHIQLQAITDEFADCDSLIVDVTINQGGYHSIALAFASHIADQRRYAFCKHPYGSPDLLQKFDILPFQNKAGETKTFTRPIYVLVSDATVSAGEEFVLAARVFPHVKVVGNRTNGMLSDILEKPLPNGWNLNLSNEIFIDHQGQCFEAIGIPVDIDRPIFDLNDIESVGHADTIRDLADEISRGESIK